MKNSILFSLVCLLGCYACQNQTQSHHQSQPDTSATPAAESVSPAVAQVAYACPMHPEITGKVGDKCSKCNMDLEPVEQPATEGYACPMHPEITGKAGDKCSKCKMDLESVKK